MLNFVARIIVKQTEGLLTALVYAIQHAPAELSAFVAHDSNANADLTISYCEVFEVSRK